MGCCHHRKETKFKLLRRFDRVNRRQVAAERISRRQFKINSKAQDKPKLL